MESHWEQINVENPLVGGNKELFLVYSGPHDQQACHPINGENLFSGTTKSLTSQIGM